MGDSTSQLSVAEYQALITGIPKYLPNATFMAASQTFTAAQAVTFLQTLHDASAAAIAAKANWKQLVVADQTAEAQNGSIAREIRDEIGIAFSNAPATLEAFLMTPRKKPKPLSAEARLAATAKAKATREARGTKGSKQKAAITGNVVGVTVTPVLAPTAAPATTPTGSGGPVSVGVTTTGTAAPAAPVVAATSASTTGTPGVTVEPVVSGTAAATPSH